MNLTLSTTTYSRLLILSAVSGACAVILFLTLVSGRQTLPVMSSCLPAFRDGGGPYYKPDSPFRTRIVPAGTEGKPMIIKGVVLSSDCSRSVPGAVIDIWQANESGSYEDEWYRGQVTADAEGNYEFETVMPRGYGEGTGYRPPHIHFKVFADGREIVTSQMFFDDVRGREGFSDEYIVNLDDKPEQLIGTHHIVLPDFP
ncbi:MAG: Chlorocatechol 1,2-dioxygenase [candidate division WS6 bacterium OLB20]|uniref:Chlorocatechol 1,2-dioxygenase n=1 Tax=candidate division WS6 bacterium OLB20 TaxID=1617426 RepID=A0A136M0F0_9BACT|nr:MAG: Chlorocatechol 1,2-dioxygenase [candidate division WS6 bacterium OLB20]